MTIDYQSCRDCEARRMFMIGISAEPFERDLASRSIEYAAVRLGMNWNTGENQELDIAAIPGRKECEMG